MELSDLSLTLHVIQSCNFNPLNAELNPICHLLALLGGATIVDVSRLRVNLQFLGFVKVAMCVSLMPTAHCGLQLASQRQKTRRIRITEVDMRRIILCVLNLSHRHNSVNSTPADSGVVWFQYEPLDAASVQEDFIDVEYLGTCIE
jgi:hypothetical protein